MEAAKLVEAAALAAQGQQYPAGALYVVATPIGNLADITLRAVHAHNERSAAAAVVERLARGERVAYVSDAGTPAVSDPGAELVAVARAAGHRVVPVPGASSALAALSVAGDVGASAFAVVGFLPARGAERARAIDALAQRSETLVVFEAPHRIESLAASLGAACPERTTTVCRELTKQFETIATMAARDLAGWLAADANRARGEFVIVLHASAVEASQGERAHDALLVPLLAALPLKQAVALAGEISGAPRNALYARALALRGSADDD